MSFEIFLNAIQSQITFSAKLIENLGLYGSCMNGPI